MLTNFPNTTRFIPAVLLIIFSLLFNKASADVPIIPPGKVAAKQFFAQLGTYSDGSGNTEVIAGRGATPEEAIAKYIEASNLILANKPPYTRLEFGGSCSALGDPSPFGYDLKLYQKYLGSDLVGEKTAFFVGGGGVPNVTAWFESGPFKCIVNTIYPNGFVTQSEMGVLRQSICPCNSWHGGYTSDMRQSLCWKGSQLSQCMDRDPDECDAVGNPINPGPQAANKFQVENDSGGFYKSLGSWNVVRKFSSVTTSSKPMGIGGQGWRYAFERKILWTGSNSAQAYRSYGTALPFELVNGVWQPNPDVSDKLVQLFDSSGNPSGWEYFSSNNNEREQYDVAGLLQSVTSRGEPPRTVTYDATGRIASLVDAFGRTFSLMYDSQGRLSSITDPGGGVLGYAYDPNSNLVSVTYPDASTRRYHYENTTYKNALTGITDERGTRYATFTYDSQGRAISSEHANNTDRYSLAYGTSSTVVTDPLGTQRTYSFQTLWGVTKGAGVSQPAGSGCGPSAESKSYDANGNVSSRKDFNGKKTTYAYDLTRNLETSRTEGLSSAGAALPETRTITTSWHPTWRLPVEVSEYAGASATGNPLRRTSTVYDDRGNVTSRSVTDVATGLTRTWTTTYTYSTAVPGLILRKVEDGPRTDVTDTVTTEYYSHDEVCTGVGTGTGRDKGCRGQVKRVTNVLGQTTQFTRHNAHGQVEEIVDPNGVVITLTYDLRQRLTSRTTAGETTAFQYDPVGQLTRLMQPDGSYIAYTYDGARRLTEVADNLGNRIVYTLDAAGNRTREEIRDPQGALAKTLVRAYDALGRMQTLTGVAAE